ncbi:MAG: septal ring lytic transglycosylase RlpA family protein [Stellaceae bacterium]
MSVRKLFSLCAAAAIALALFAGGGKLAGLHVVSPAFATPADALAGTASWYGRPWQGRKTASGTRFDPHRLTAAHRSLPLNTRVRVTNLENAKSVTVLINDRGPYVRGRVIDLSKAAARSLGMVKEGVAPVRIEVVKPADRGAPVIADADDRAARSGSDASISSAASGVGAASILLISLWAALRLRKDPLSEASADS